MPPACTKHLISTAAENRLEVFKRRPSDLRRYVQWSAETKAIYGTIPSYVMQERLHWQPLPSSTPKTGPIFELRNLTPFADPSDYKTLPNDWPYGWALGITHIIVWLKHRLEVEPSRGDMTPKSRTQVQEFVQRTFVDRVQDLPGDKDKVQWFKNWTALQSVPGLEHLHVLVRDIPREIIAEWTNGEETVQDRV